MDYFQYMRAVRDDYSLTYTQKITALILASHYDFSKGEPCYPTNKTMSLETSLSIASIVRAKRVLSERGYLCSQRRMDNSSLYIPMLPESRGYAHSDELNTHINTQLNTNINTKENKVKDDSNESSLVSINLINNKPEELVTLSLAKLEQAESLPARPAPWDNFENEKEEMRHEEPRSVRNDDINPGQYVRYDGRPRPDLQRLQEIAARTAPVRLGE